MIAPGTTKPAAAGERGKGAMLTTDPPRTPKSLNETTKTQLATRKAGTAPDNKLQAALIEQVNTWLAGDRLRDWAGSSLKPTDGSCYGLDFSRRRLSIGLLNRSTAK
jgi:hypothetical protein